MSLAKICIAGSLLLGAGACGAVPDDGADGPMDGPMDAKPPPPPGTTTYQGTLAMTQPAPFGMLPGTCEYTMTLRQIELELQMSTTGTIIAASLQNLTEEKIVGTCPYEPAGPTILKFKLKSATPVGTTTMVVMEGLPTNAPVASLGITLTPTAGAFTAAARWTRTDQAPVFNWTVTANLTLTLK
jgi:hypothetical protein